MGKIRRVLLQVVAVIFLVGGIMGLVKAIFPQLDWLSFRYLITRSSTYALGEYPMYARVYGAAMAVLEIATAIIILAGKKSLYPIALITIGINMIGCLAAMVIGDFGAIISLILRVFPFYLVVFEYQSGNKYSKRRY